MQWLSRMWETTRKWYAQAGIELPDYDTFRERGIVDLHSRGRSVVMLEDFRKDPTKAPLADASGKLELYSEVVASFDLDDCAGHAVWRPAQEWLGSPLASSYPIHLLSDQPRNKLHSQLDASPHSAPARSPGASRWPTPQRCAPREHSRRRRGGGLQRARTLPSRRCHDDRRDAGSRTHATGAWYDPEPKAVVTSTATPTC